MSRRRPFHSHIHLHPTGVALALALLGACAQTESPRSPGLTAAGLDSRDITSIGAGPDVAAWNKCCQDANDDDVFDSCGSPTHNDVTGKDFCQVGWVKANCKKGSTPGQCTEAINTEVDDFTIAGDDDVGVVVAEVFTGAGQQVRFLEAEPGELAVDVLSPAGVELPEFAELQEGTIDEAEFFRRVAPGAAPPAELVSALRRAEALRDSGASEAGEDELSETAEGEFASNAEQSTSTTAAAALPHWLQLCNNWDFGYCWMNQTGNPWCQRKCYFMEGRVLAIDGSITVRFRYKKGGSWKTLKHVTVPKGYEYYVNQKNWWLKRWRRFEVLGNNAHHLHHWACYGLD